MPSDSQEPRVRVAPRADETLGDLAADFAAAYGLTPDPWQRLVLDDWLAQRGGHWSALTCGLAVPRQNGKNALLEIRELFGMVGRGERILHTAHEVKTAQKHFRRLMFFFGQQANDPAARFPELNELVESVRRTNGQEGVYLKNGGSVEVVARSKSSGRGFTVDTLVMDEAQELSDDALEALMPTTAAAPHGDPQWLFTGTPPGPNAVGEVFTRVRREALSDHPGRVAWHEWSIERFGDLDNRELWRLTNPALASGRLQMSVIEGERGRFSDSGFARERLGWWSAGSASRAIPEDVWSATAVDSVEDRGVKCFAVAFSFEGDRVALAAAQRDGESVHGELIDLAEQAPESGLAKLAEWLADRRDRAAEIVVLGGAGAPLLQMLRERGLRNKRQVRMLTTAEYRAACATTEEGLRAGSVTHLRDGQEALDVSVSLSDKKVRGDGFGWASTATAGDEVPFEAFSAAVYAARTTKRNPGRKQRVG